MIHTVHEKKIDTTQGARGTVRILFSDDGFRRSEWGWDMHWAVESVDGSRLLVRSECEALASGQWNADRRSDVPEYWQTIVRLGRVAERLGIGVE